MPIYTAPSMNFIDTFVNAANKRDERAKARTADYMEGMKGLVQGGVDAYKWQQRKHILDKKEDLLRELEELKAERESLMNAGPGKSMNLDMIMNGLNPLMDTGRISNG